MSLTILGLVFVLGLVMGIPVAVTLGLASVGYLLAADMPLVVVPQKMYAGIDTFVLLSIPGFILAGNLMSNGGITLRIVRFANAMVGWIRGGLGLSNVAGSMLFGGISGTAIASAGILALVGFANVFGWILVSERIPQTIADAILSVTDNKFVVILIINLFLLFCGMFMETIAALIVLFVPLLQLATSVGIEPLHFATFAVLNLMIGLTTPPVGVCLFICAGIANLSLSPVIKAIVPFLLANIAVLMLVSYFPVFSTWLPSLLMK